jgi:phosphatidylglycerophosphatase A
LAIFKPDDVTLLIFLPIIFILGTVTAHFSEYTLGKDSGHIVIDELCGYLLAIIFIPKTLGFLVAAFVLFRGFDIIKPPPIRAVEKFIPGGAGVMLDDTLAALYTNICLQLWKFLIQ